MNTRTLGRHGLTVSSLGLGCMGMSQAYGPTDDAQSLATLRRAIDVGVTFWDTAMSYGAGHNERLLGRALVGRRDQVVLATKFGIVRDADGVHLDARPEHVREHCEASLQRLGVEHIDLYYLHRVDPEVPIQESIGAMADLVAEGKVSHLGISECSAPELESAAVVHPISALQCEWSLWWREIEDDVLPVARRLGIGVVAYSPLGRGFLTGEVQAGQLGGDDLRRHDPRFHGEPLQRNLALVHELRRLAAERGVTAGQLALAWLLGHGDDIVPIPGTKRAARLDENAAAIDVALSPADLDRLDAVAPRAAWPAIATPSPCTARPGCRHERTRRDPHRTRRDRQGGRGTPDERLPRPAYNTRTVSRRGRRGRAVWRQRPRPRRLRTTRRPRLPRPRARPSPPHLIRRRAPRGRRWPRTRLRAARTNDPRPGAQRRSSGDRLPTHRRGSAGRHGRAERRRSRCLPRRHQTRPQGCRRPLRRLDPHHRNPPQST